MRAIRLRSARTARVTPALLEAVSDAEIYCGFGVPEELLEAGSGLRWVHSAAAGVGGSLSPTMRERDVVFTNSAGIHAPPMAETVLGMILFFGRGLRFAVENQREARWDTAPYYAAGAPLSELSMSTVGIVEAARMRTACSAVSRVMLSTRSGPASTWQWAQVWLQTRPRLSWSTSMAVAESSPSSDEAT